VNEIGKILVVLGLCIVVLGLVLWTGVGKGWFGKLPGDIQISRGNFRFYFPLATCLLISLVLTLLMWLFRR
jgi:ribose/xylose/arabinose/galactoside ABC-type transport system permease subunit